MTTVGFPQLGKAGRLGNQLWQIASTIGVAHTMDASPAFPESWKYREFFRLPEEWFMPDDIVAGFARAHEQYPLDHIDPRARVYMQDAGLWWAYREQVRHYFQPSVAARQYLLDNYAWYVNLPGPILAVHARRGDLVTENISDFHPVRTTAYFDAALDIAVMDVPESVVFFSDDLPWCVDHYGDRVHGARFFSGGAVMPHVLEEYEKGTPTDWVDLFAMMYAQHHIIANSTYSWWAAILARDPSPISPSPESWFGPALDYIDTTLMFPSDIDWRFISAT